MGSTSILNHSTKYLRFDFYGSQRYLKYILKRHTKFRNYFNTRRGIPANAGHYALGQLIAEAVNSTLISLGHSEYSNELHPKMLPAVLAFDGENRTLPYIGKRYFQGIGERPSLIRTDPNDLNFAVCGITEWERISVWDFTSFFQSFDQLSAYLLLLAMLLVSITAFSGVRTGFRFTFFYTIQTIISVHHGRKNMRSGIFVLWMLCLVLLVPLYFSDIASKVIIPAKEKRLTSFDDVERQHFAVASPNGIATDFFVDVVNSLKGMKYVSAEVLTLGRLLKQTVNRTYFKDEVYYKMASNREVIIIGWPFALSAMNQANIVMKRLPEEERKKCYVGEKLLKYGDSFHVFLPPRSAHIALAFRYLEQSGIAQRWIYEYQAAFFSARVQKRVMYKSPTSVKEEKTPPENLKLKGKIVTIFLLCGSLILVSILCFLYEISKHVAQILRRVYIKTAIKVSVSITKW